MTYIQKYLQTCMHAFIPTSYKHIHTHIHARTHAPSPPTHTHYTFDHQYGFRPKHSTGYAALELIDRIRTPLDKDEYQLIYI